MRQTPVKLSYGACDNRFAALLGYCLYYTIKSQNNQSLICKKIKIYTIAQLSNSPFVQYAK